MPSHPTPPGANLLDAVFYGYYINLDERGEFYADVRDIAGNTVWEVHTQAAQELIEDGFVRSVRDPNQIGRYLKEDAGILPANATVHEPRAFEAMIERLNRKNVVVEADHDGPGL